MTNGANSFSGQVVIEALVGGLASSNQQVQDLCRHGLTMLGEPVVEYLERVKRDRELKAVQLRAVNDVVDAINRRAPVRYSAVMQLRAIVACYSEHDQSLQDLVIMALQSLDAQAAANAVVETLLSTKFPVARVDRLITLLQRFGPIGAEEAFDLHMISNSRSPARDVARKILAAITPVATRW